MQSWLKLVVVAAILPVLLPSRILACPTCTAADVTTPGLPDDGMIFPESPAGFDPSGNFPKVSTEKTGNIPTKDGRILRVDVELGDILVITGESGQISYRATAEADPRDPASAEFLQRFTVDARETSWGATLTANVPWHPLHGRFNASLEIHVPRQYSIEVTTGGGSIEVQDINGRVSLTTSGGNIKVGHVGGDDSLRPARARSRDQEDRGKPVLPISARIETMGGHIAVGDVDGTLRAKTLGGHITTGDIRGDALLSTSGGQIEAGRIAGAATLDSGGGSIHVKGAGSRINADAASGGIVLREAGVPLRVFANSGSITAWLNAAADDKGREKSRIRKPHGISEIASSNGDVTIYIPRELEATIDALVEGGGHRIVADPALPVKIRYGGSEEGGRTIRGEGVLNGGGDVLHLKCVSGDIMLRLEDSTNGFGVVQSGTVIRGVSADPRERPNPSPGMEDPGDFSDPSGFLAEIRRRVVESIWGGIPVDADELQKHLVHSVSPVYPEVARQAGIEGNVVLRALISPSGRVADLKILDGPPILARAAAEAVQQWEYQPVRVNGRPAGVVTTLVLSFRLR